MEIHPSDLLIWQPTRASSEDYALLRREELLGRLKWDRPAGSLATASTPDAQWTLKRVGFLRPRVTVRRAGAGEDRAVLQYAWTGAVQISSGGRTFNWVHPSVWHHEWKIRDERGQDVLTMVPLGGDRLCEARIHQELDPETNEVLVFLAFYLMIMMQREMDASTAVIVAATAAS